MKAVLVNPSYVYSTPWLQVTEPLGLLYLASYIRTYTKHEINIVDCLDSNAITKCDAGYWYGATHEEMLDRIERHSPDVVGVTCLFSKKKTDFLNCVTAIKKRFPDITVVAGGTYPSLFPEEVLDTGLVDYCVIGEGERCFADLLNTLSGAGDKQLAEIEGLAFKLDGKTTVTKKKDYIKDLDTIPLPARDLINYETYLTRKTVLHGLGLRRAASILTSRSCPNRCNFCSMYLIHGPMWRGRSAQDVFAEMKQLHADYGVSEFFIMDDNFTYDRDRVVEICSSLIASGMNIRWNTPNGISINTLDYDLLKLMKQSGCKSICIAIESGDEELRNKVIGKRLSNDKIRQVAADAARLRIFTTAFYIIGMPGETAEKFQATLDQIAELPLNGVAAAFANPLPGTKLYRDCIKNNWQLITESEQSGNILYRPFIITADFTEEELIKREKEFYRTYIKTHFFSLIFDTLLLRNLLLYPPFLFRILKDRIFR